MTEKFRWLAAVIAAHPDHRVVGRTRLQKTVRLLQRLGAPLDYAYMIHFYGPYSEGVQADIGLLENLGMVTEEVKISREGAPYSILSAGPEAIKLANAPELKPFLPAIKTMSDTDAVVLELAATYDAFRKTVLQATGVSFCTRRHFGRPIPGEKELYIRLAYSGINTVDIEEGLAKFKAFAES